MLATLEVGEEGGGRPAGGCWAEGKGEGGGRRRRGGEAGWTSLIFQLGLPF